MKTLHQWLQLAKKAETLCVLDEFLRLFFTPQECEQLEKRYLLIDALMHDQCSQRAIAKELNVSIAKITRGSNALKHISPKLKNMLTHFLITQGQGNNNV